MQTISRSKAVLGPNVKAALLMCLSMVLLSSGDTLIKLVGQQLAVGQIMLIRSMFACLLFTGYLLYRRKPVMPKHMFERHNLLRAGLDAMVVASFLSALMLMPIAIVTTLSWLAPLFLTLMSALWLGEKVPMLRWVAVVVGFVGVLMVSNPGSAGFSWVYVLPLLTAVLMAVRDIVTRRIDAQMDTLYIAYLPMLVFMLVGGVWSLWDWRAVDLRSVLLLLVCAVLVSLSFVTQIAAVRMGDLSFVAPFAFISVIIASFYGVVMWNEVPSLLTVLGMLLIVGAALVVVASDRGKDAA